MCIILKDSVVIQKLDTVCGQIYKDKKVKTIIAGSRKYPTDVEEDSQEFGRLQRELFAKHVKIAINNSQFNISEVVCGMAKGADLAGKDWGDENGVTVKEFPAKWKQFGNSAGPQRNIEMARHADAAIVLWDGRSKGSDHMIKVANMQGLKVFVYLIEKESI